MPSYLEDYLTYASGNECPEMFHLWAGVTTISAAVSRKVWLPFEDVAIFPNIYVMYVGDAGNGKSWAMAKAKRVLGDVIRPDGFKIPISGSLETPPGLWRHMAGNPNTDPPVASSVAFATKWPYGGIRDVHPMTLMANEFINFISLDEKGWINALNDIYDEDMYHYRTKHQGEDTLIGPYIVMLGALTTQVSAELQKARIISTGLSRRTIFQYGRRLFESPHPKPKFTPEQMAAKARCVEHLNKLAANSVNGAFNWPDDVDTWWTKWYAPHLANVPTHNPSLQPWYASKSTQMLKLAMLLSLGERLDLNLTVDHFEAADRYFTILEDDLPKIFGGVGRNELAGVAMKMFEFVQAINQPVPMNRMHTQFFAQCRPPHDFDQCITHLCSTEQLVRKGYADTATNQMLDYIGTPSAMATFEAKVAAAKSAAMPVPQPPADPNALR